jgi:Tfp pilus assembly protein PilO
VKAKFSRRSAVFLIIGGDLLLLLLGWTLLVSPQRQTAASIARATQAAEVQIQDAQRLVQPTTAAAAPKQPEIRTAALYQLAKAMPATTDMPDVLLELDQVARAAGVSVNSITPGPVSAGTGFGVLPISIAFSGDFYSLTDLLYRLRTLVAVRHGELDASGRLFAVDTVGISGTGNQLTASVTVNTFVYGVSAPVVAVVPPPSTDTTNTNTTTTTTTPAPSADVAP